MTQIGEHYPNDVTIVLNHRSVASTITLIV